MSLLTIPGLIDPHVHLRDPGQTEKEDFYTGTKAALAGGYTTVLDMPNNSEPITSEKRLLEKKQQAREKAVSDIGFYFGTLGDNLAEFTKIRGESHVFGLKIYLNHTTGNYLLSQEKLEEVFRAWPKHSPILLHAEDETFEQALEVIKKVPRKTHLCHLSSQFELKKVMEAKEAGLPVSCGVTPHHLFLNESDEKSLGSLGKMRPVLKPQKDVDFLWKHLAAIDLIESDHAPHTLEEKKDDNPPNGVPGLETTLPLLLTAVTEGRLELHEVIRLCHDGPARIFNVRQRKGTYVELDLARRYEIDNKNLHSKSPWTPFHGKKVVGCIKAVYLRDTKVFANGDVLVKPGFGNVL